MCLEYCLALAAQLMITVYHGAQYWDRNSPVRARMILYWMGRGKTYEKARTYAEYLFERLNDNSDRYLLEKALLDAQTSGHLSPFISTTEKREVALQFARRQCPGYLLTITGPKESFYDFADVRSANSIPDPTEFSWMEEKGIPNEISLPFKIKKVEKINSVTEQCECIFGGVP